MVRAIAASDRRPGRREALAQPHDARERVDDAEARAPFLRLRARHQQPAIVGAEIERGIGRAVIRRPRSRWRTGEGTRRRSGLGWRLPGMLAQALGEAKRDGSGRGPYPSRAGYAIDYASFQCPAGGGSSNGRTADSDSASLGSNPSPPAIQSILRRKNERGTQADQETCARHVGREHRETVRSRCAQEGFMERDKSADERAADRGASHASSSCKPGAIDTRPSTQDRPSLTVKYARAYHALNIVNSPKYGKRPTVRNPVARPAPVQNNQFGTKRNA